jgi:hypothetical protein
MQYEAIISALLQNSKSGADWTHDDYSESRPWSAHALKSNVNIWLKVNTETEEKFEESWHQNLPKKEAEKFTVTLHYGPTPLETFTMVSIDGHRATVPIPDKHEGDQLTVGKLEYAIALGLSAGSRGALEKYLPRCHIAVGPQTRTHEG